jgi:hypothetical protein
MNVHKRCCLGKIDWGQFKDRPFGDQIPFLSLRGRNIAFIAEIMSALQIDTWKPNLPYSEVKRAFTSNAVRRIHEAIPILWPNYSDYVACLERERSASSALYTGSYKPNDIFRSLCRHALYTERIFLTDPFCDPRRVSNQLNPLLHPEQHRANTIKWT